MVSGEHRFSTRLAAACLLAVAVMTCAARSEVPTQPTADQFDLDADGRLGYLELQAWEGLIEYRRRVRVARGKGRSGPDAELGPGATAVQQRAARAADYSARHNGHAVLVMVGSRIVFERYDNGQHPDRPHLLHSATKTFWGVTVAAMIEDGLIRPYGERIAETITEWSDQPRKQNITIRHLLDPTSGLARNQRLLHPKHERSRGVRDVYRAALTLEATAEPGRVFRYGPTEYYVLGELMKRKLAKRDQNPLQYLQQRILDPIGVEPGPWVSDPSGNPHIPGRGTMTARHWARFGGCC